MTAMFYFAGYYSVCMSMGGGGGGGAHNSVSVHLG